MGGGAAALRAADLAGDINRRELEEGGLVGVVTHAVLRREQSLGLLQTASRS